MATTELIILALSGSLIGLAAGEVSFALAAGWTSRWPDRLSWLLAGGGALAMATLPAARDGLIAACAAWGLVGVLLLVLACDVRERLVYPAVVYPGIALAIVTAPLLRSSVVDALLAAVASGGLFGGFYLLARLRYGPGALGAGDIPTAALLGAVVGSYRLLPALALVSVIGVSIALIAGLRARSRRASFAYAPVLCLAALIALVFRTP